MAKITRLDHDLHNGADYTDNVRVLSLTVWAECKYCHHEDQVRLHPQSLTAEHVCMSCNSHYNVEINRIETAIKVKKSDKIHVWLSNPNKPFKWCVACGLTKRSVPTHGGAKTLYRWPPRRGREFNARYSKIICAGKPPKGLEG